jgi:membrane-bound metal-dependent hydrolase YbcI (DUF457 family)
VLGRHHLLLSLFTGAILLLPFFKVDLGLVIFLLIIIAIGSLVPDADSPDAAIFHSKIVGIKGKLGVIINGIIGPILPAFGWVTRWLIYKPGIFILGKTLLKKYGVEERHRGFLHSFIGIGFATIMMAIYVGVVLLILNLLTWYYLLFIPCFFFGAFLHLVEDSATITGIQFNSPFSDLRIHGKLITRPDESKKPDLFTGVMGVAVIAAFFLLNMLNLSIGLALVLSILFVIIAWCIFLYAVAGIKADHEPLPLYNNVKSLL